MERKLFTMKKIKFPKSLLWNDLLRYYNSERTQSPFLFFFNNENIEITPFKEILIIYKRFLGANIMFN